LAMERHLGLDALSMLALDIARLETLTEWHAAERSILREVRGAQDLRSSELGCLSTTDQSSAALVLAPHSRPKRPARPHPPGRGCFGFGSHLRLYPTSHPTENPRKNSEGPPLSKNAAPKF
jgi:hypothetical protein